MIVIKVFALKISVTSTKPRSLPILWKFSVGRSDEEKETCNRQIVLANSGGNSGLTI